jgi:hypothetical protein
VDRLPRVSKAEIHAFGVVPNILLIRVYLKSIYWLPFASKACPFRKSTILPGQKQTVSPQRVFAFSGRVVIACQRLMDLNAKAG